MSLLSAIDLCKTYRGRQILCGVSLRVSAGQIVGLLGPNGAGKTTCFRLIAGMEYPDTGRVLLGEEDLTALPVHLRARRGLGYLPQDSSVFRSLSVRDNLLAVLETRRKLGREERCRQAQQLLQDFGLEAVADSHAGLLSGGERRRTEIARALAMAPNFLLLDEPFAGVDPIAVQEIKTLMDALRRRGIGVLLTDHNVREALDLCDYACILHSGRVLTAASSAEVSQDPVVRRKYLGESF